MHYRIILLVLFTLLSACGGGGSSSSGGSGNSDNLVLVLGDSIGRGIGADLNYPSIIGTNTGLPVVNESVSSINAEDAVARVPGLIAQYNPTYIVALLGTNNALGAGGKASGAVGALQNLAQICIANGITCVIGTLPPITLSSRQNAIASQISSGIRGIGGVRIADNNAVMNGSHIGSDGIHPNSGGQLIIGNNFSALLP